MRLDVEETNAVIRRTVNAVDDENRSYTLIFAVINFYGLFTPTESQLREKLQKWLSPPDPSTNQNIARKAHHKGTASWFFQGSIYEEWKLSSSLLWIHGKRIVCFLPATPHSTYSYLHSGIREKCLVVCYFLLILRKVT